MDTNPSPNPNPNPNSSPTPNLIKAGAMGISILVASGDQGVCGREGCGVFFKKVPG